MGLIFCLLFVCLLFCLFVFLAQQTKHVDSSTFFLSKTSHTVNNGDVARRVDMVSNKCSITAHFANSYYTSNVKNSNEK